MALYDLNILSGPGFATGINDAGCVSGAVENEQSVPTPQFEFQAAWWNPPSYDLAGDVDRDSIDAIDDAGDALNDSVIFNVSDPTVIIADLQAAFKMTLEMCDINDAHQVLGMDVQNLRSFIYDWVSLAVTWLDPLPGQSDSVPGGMNNLGDVVGSSGNRGFFYSDGRMHDVGDCILFGINDGKLAVGNMNGGQTPAYIKLAVSNPQLVPIQLPHPSAPLNGPAGQFNSPMAVAVNGTGTFVGCAFNADNQDLGYPFVGQCDPLSIPVDLNDLVPPNSGFHLWVGSDINNAGQIAGIALTPEGLMTGFVAAPRYTVPNFSAANLVKLVLFILGGVAVDGGGPTSGGPVPPYGPVEWTALPLEQREVLLSFAVTDLADLMNDQGARTRIQAAAAAAASRAVAQRRRLHEKAPSPAQTAQMVQTRQRFLHKFFAGRRSR